MKKLNKKTKKVYFTIGEEEKREFNAELFELGLTQNEVIGAFIRAFLTRKQTGATIGLEIRCKRLKR